MPLFSVLKSQNALGILKQMCYDNLRGEFFMENQKENTTPEQEGYVPRPAWQVWAARIGLVVFIGIVIAQILQLAGVGL